MPDGLHAAQELAERVRFSGDSLRPQSEGNTSHAEAYKGFLAQTGLRISQEVTPTLADRLNVVYDRIAIPKGTVEAFVYAGADLQAACFAGSTSQCVIQFSSSLVDLLDEDEFGFVAGHELGHFLLGHGVATMEHERQSLEFFIQQRSQEISVDRIGLLACGSLDVALRALMKTISGLTSKHLRFDVGTFISQLRKPSNPFLHNNPTASHPSIVVRCRALLWFSLNDLFLKGAHAFSAEQMRKLDEHIQNDLHRYVDGPARQLIEEAKEHVALWMAAYAFVQDGIFAKHEQEIFARTFGEDNLEKLKNFLRGAPTTDACDRVKQNLQSSLAELAALIPTSCEAEVEKIRQRTQFLTQ
jgi:hypothetical protein